MADSIGKASATFTADIQQFFAGTKAIRNEMAALKKDTSGGAGAINMGGIGHGLEAMLPGLAHLATAGGAVMFFRELVGHARELVVQAERLEIPIQRMQELAWFAEKAGKGVEALVAPMQKLERTIGEAFMDNAEAAKPFKEMQLSIGDLVAMDPAEQLEAVGKALLSIENPALRTALGMEVFGKSYKQIEPILRDMARGGEAAIISKSSITALSDAALAAKSAWHEFKAAASEASGMMLHTFFGLGEGVKTQRELNAEAAREADIRRETAVVMKERQKDLDREVKAQKEVAEFAEKASKIYERIAGISRKVAEEMGGKSETEKERDRLIEEFSGAGRTPAELGEAYRAMFPQGPLAAELEAIKSAKEEAAKLQDELNKVPRTRPGVGFRKEYERQHEEAMRQQGWNPLFPIPKANEAAMGKAYEEEEARLVAASDRERTTMAQRLAALQPFLKAEWEEILVEEARIAIIAELTDKTEEAVRSQREFKASQDAAKASAKELANAQREVASALSLTFTAEEKYAKAMGDLDKWDKLGALGAGAAGSRNRARLEAEAKQELLDAWKREGKVALPPLGVRGTQEEYQITAKFTEEARQGRDVQARFHDFVQNRLGDVASDVKELVRIGNATNKFEAPL